MQNVANMNLASLVEQGVQGEKTAVSTRIPDGAINAVNQLFLQLRAIFPAWRHSFPDAESYKAAKRVWLETLVNEGITTIAQLQNGIEQAKKSSKPYWPSIGEFVAWCKMKDYQALGLPDEDKLYHRLHAFMRFGIEELQQFKFESNAEYWLITDLYVRCRAGEWSEKTLRAEIGKALDKMAGRLKRCEPIPEPKITLPEQVRVIDKDKVSAFFSGLLKQLGGKKK